MSESDIQVAVAQLENATRFLTGPFMVAQIVEGVQAAVIRAHSPWLNRKDAAEYARCSPSEVDRVARAGALKCYMRGGTPMFRRDDVDKLILSGQWRTGAAKHTT